MLEGNSKALHVKAMLWLLYRARMRTLHSDPPKVSQGPYSSALTVPLSTATTCEQASSYPQTQPEQLVRALRGPE